MKISLPDSLLNQLPEHEKIEEIPQNFNDSTHRIWRLLNANKRNYFLKVSNKVQSPFWETLNELFDYNLNTEIALFSKSYHFIDQACTLEIPYLIKSNQNDDYSYILTNEVKGYTCGSNVNYLMLSQLAEHLSELHTKTNQKWGSLNSPKFKSDDWSKRLEITLKESAKKWGGVFSQSDNYLKQSVNEISKIKVNRFVPMMPDLRWDQFLQNNNQLCALVDLDAFVYAPRELDFVILEYLLTPDQVNTFNHVYTKKRDIPDISDVRIAYRLLLFYMQILGETNLEDWMEKETLF